MIVKPLGQPLLPLVTEPYVFENIQGYVLRLSELNKYERPRWIYQMIDSDGSDITYALLGTIAAGLPVLAGCSQEEVAGIAYSSSGADNHNIISIGRRGRVAASLMEIKRPRICPGCVREFGAVFALWDFKFYGVCSRHRCLLIDRCPNPACERRLTWWRPQLGSCAGCEQPFTLTVNREIDVPKVLAFSSLLERIWGVPFVANVEPKDCPWNTACFSEVMDCIRMLASRLTVALGSERLSGQLPQQALSEIVAQAFHNWPNGFFEYVDSLIEADIKEGRGFSIINTSRLGSLFARVMEGGAYPYFADMKEALLEFIHRSKFGSKVTGKGGNRLNQIPSFQKQFMTRSEAMKELGISAPTFRRAFVNGELKGEILQMGKQHVYRVTVSSVEKYKLVRD
jgi:hypothetical protein